MICYKCEKNQIENAYLFDGEMYCRECWAATKEGPWGKLVFSIIKDEAITYDAVGRFVESITDVKHNIVILVEQ